jgi:hypothetical protein
LHLLKKCNLYNVPKILPTSLAKYIKRESQSNLRSSNFSSIAPSLAASFLQMGQPTTPSASTTNLNKIPTQNTTTNSNNFFSKELLGPSSSVQNPPLVRVPSQSSSTASASTNFLSLTQSNNNSLQ